MLITIIIALLFANSRLVFCQIFSYDVPKFQECGPWSYIPACVQIKEKGPKLGKLQSGLHAEATWRKSSLKNLKKHTQRAQVKITQCKRGIGMIQDQC